MMLTDRTQTYAKLLTDGLDEQTYNVCLMLAEDLLEQGRAMGSPEEETYALQAYIFLLDNIKTLATWK